MNARLLQELAARLPELEWKVSAFGAAFSEKSLPSGLFRSSSELTSATCIAEIKADIQILASQTHERSIYYLAQQIHQKINVLVTFCHIHAKKIKIKEKTNFNVNRITTRQQWLQTLEQEINRLSTQRDALTKTLQKMQTRSNHQALLQLQAELGEVERRLTLAHETLLRA